MTSVGKTAPAAAGLNALQLDAAVLAGSSLQDLRLSDADARQVVEQAR